MRVTWWKAIYSSCEYIGGLVESLRQVSLSFAEKKREIWISFCVRPTKGSHDYH